MTRVTFTDDISGMELLTVETDSVKDAEKQLWEELGIDVEECNWVKTTITPNFIR
jgi:hypothetical protein